MANDDLAEAVASYMRGREAGLLGGGIALLAAGEGYAKVSLTITAEMLNGLGTAHGGVIFTLADCAFAYACNSRNEAAVAQQASITFLSAGRAGETLTAEAAEQAAVGRAGVYTVTVTGADGRAVAVFQGLSRSVGKKVLPDAAAQPS
jgi:acyl-CoA thioesterase